MIYKAFKTPANNKHECEGVTTNYHYYYYYLSDKII